MSEELGRLVRWYATEWLGEASGIDRLHEPHPGPWDLTGAPEWSGPFKAFLLSPADRVNEEEYYLHPLRAALLAVGHNDTGHYRLLSALRVSWDTDLAAWRCGVHPDQAHDAMLAALRNLRRLYALKAP